MGDAAEKWRGRRESWSSLHPAALACLCLSLILTGYGARVPDAPRETDLGPLPATPGLGAAPYRPAAESARVYKIGDRGPAGGVVFYDKGAYSFGWRYLEAAREDQSEGARWDDRGRLAGSSATGIGAGMANTRAIVTAQGKAGFAAQLCDDLELGGFDDWYLPSKGELNEMNERKREIGGFAPAWYWSSSEYGQGAAWAHNVFDGNQIAIEKNTNARVRAIRAF
jgi:hypothetical protein